MAGRRGVEPEKAAFSCALRFEKLDDFRPECLVKNVETLATFFERRNLLQDLAAVGRQRRFTGQPAEDAVPYR